MAKCISPWESCSLSFCPPSPPSSSSSLAFSFLYVTPPLYCNTLHRRFSCCSLLSCFCHFFLLPGIVACFALAIFQRWSSLFKIFFSFFWTKIYLLIFCSFHFRGKWKEQMQFYIRNSNLFKNEDRKMA